MKICNKCRQSKDLSMFSKRSLNKDGHNYTCKTCVNNKTSESCVKENKTHESWRSMKSRCSSEKTNGWEHYKGRGIKVCDRWLCKKDGYKNFLFDMGERPLGMTLDRIDVNGDYEAQNCKWSDSKEQSQNRRNNHLITIDGETKCMSEWSVIYNIFPALISKRLLAGWSDFDAVTTPPRLKKQSYLYMGELTTLPELSKRTGIHLRTLQVRIRDQGMSVEDALLKPYKSNKELSSNG